MIFRWRGWCLVLLLILLPAPVSSQSDPAVVQVVRVIDGDTIRVWNVFGDREKVRYIGINTPEIHHPMKGIEPFVNAWLVENGYAAVMTVPPNVKYQELFLRLQREAREAGAGPALLEEDCGPLAKRRSNREP